MGKFEGILFCTDLDGTLLNSRGTVSKENREAIEYFKREGGSFTIITGRPPAIAGDIYEMSGANIPYGCINGSAIYDPAKGEYLWMDTMPHEGFLITDYVYKNMPDIGIQVNTADKIYFCRDNPAMVHFREITGYPKLEKSYTELEAEPWIKVVFSTHIPERLAEIRAEIDALPWADCVEFVSGADDFCEILPKGNTKGTVLQKMAELLGIDMKKTVAVGDYENDVDMLRRAGVGYAMGNACPEAKAVADRITVNCDEHAIAAIVAELDSGIVKFE